MSDISGLIAEFYKTNGETKTAAQEEKLAAQAQGELFMKMAAAENIDVDGLLKAGRTDIVDHLWSNFQNIQKQASEQTDTRATKEAQAQAEHEEKRATAEKLAFADLQGRVMAHSYVQELGNIANGGEVNKTAASLAGVKEAKATEHLAKLKEHASSAAKRVAGAVGRATGVSQLREAHQIGKRLETHGYHPAVAGLAEEGRSHALREGGKRLAGTTAAVAATGGGAAALHHHMKKKESSAIDSLAAEAAVLKVAQWTESLGGNPDQIVYAAEEAAEKIAAADTLELFDQESVKVAAAPDWETAVDWRACEMLEGLGYPITWPS